MKPFFRAGVGALALPAILVAQARGHWPPDSLINTKVIPHNTPVMEVVDTKLVARQMMRMVEEITRRLDTLPEHDHTGPNLQVTCATCHRGVSRPMPLATLIQETATSAGADSVTRLYRALRERYYGRDAYDFGEPSLNIAACRLARARRFDEAFALLRLRAIGRAP